jgi:hypothetical protein
MRIIVNTISTPCHDTVGAAAHGDPCAEALARQPGLKKTELAGTNAV